jgi:hypothetical protein
MIPAGRRARRPAGPLVMSRSANPQARPLGPNPVLGAPGRRSIPITTSSQPSQASAPQRLTSSSPLPKVPARRARSSRRRCRGARYTRLGARCRSGVCAAWIAILAAMTTSNVAVSRCLPPRGTGIGPGRSRLPRSSRPGPPGVTWPGQAPRLPTHAVASSSRTQIAVRTARAAVRLIWERPSVNVRQRPAMNVPIVTQLVTRLASESASGLVHAWLAVK